MKKTVILLTFIFLFILDSFSQVWVQKAPVPGGAGLDAPIYFSIGTKLYVGGGWIGGNAINTFYEYTPTTNTWVQKANLPGAIYSACCFDLNGKGYVVCGATPSLTNTVYQYDPTNNTWQIKNAFTGGARQNIIGFSTGGKGYLFGGFTGGSTVGTDMWEYNDALDTWTQKASCPGPGRDGPAGLVINSQIFVGMGGNSSASSVYTDFYRFDPIANTYTQVSNSPVGRDGPANFAIGNIGYLGIGYGGTSVGALSDFNKYDPATDTWTTTNNFGRTGSGNVFCATVGNLPYVGCGISGLGGYIIDTWTWANVCTLATNLGNDTTLCGGSFTLTDTNSNSTHLWSTGATTASINVTTTGSYWVKVTQGNCVAYDTINVTFSSAPAPIHLANDTTYCGNFSRILSTGNANTLWSTGARASQITVATSGTYWAQVSNVCGSVRDSIILSVNPLPTVNLGNDTTLCQGSDVILNAGNTGATYLWDDNTTGQTLSVSAPGIYWVNVTSNGCTKRDSIMVSYVSPLAPFSLGNDTTYCAGFSRILSTGNANTLWSTGVTASQITVTSSGIYWAQMSNACGSVRDSIMLSVNPLPTVNLGNDTILCQGSDVILNAGNTGATYLWDDNTTGQTLSVSVPGIYWVNVTSNGCTKRDSIMVSYVSPLAPFSLGNDTTYCAGFSRILSTGNANTLWSTGVTTSQITVTSSGIYWAQMSNACGSVRDSIMLSVNPLPTVNLGNDTILCQGSDVILNAGNTGATYLWDDNTTGQTLSVSAPGIYWVNVTSNGCTKRDSIMVSYVSPLASFSLGNDTTYCGSFSRVIYTVDRGTLWSTAQIDSQITVTNPGTYWAQESNACGSVRDSITISEKPLPIVDLGNDTAICIGNSLILNAGNTGATYLWDDNSTAQTLAINTPNTYWVDVTINGCTKRDSVIISNLAAPSPFTIGSDTSICQDSSIVLNAYQSNSQYFWNNGDTSSFIIVNQTGQYIVIDSNQCGSASASVTVTTVMCTCRIAIPTAFSPNGDGKNELFSLLTQCPIENYELNIYNRWGQLVFTTSSLQDKWDGTYKGAPQPLGVYAYFVHYKDPYTHKEHSQAGNVTLVR